MKGYTEKITMIEFKKWPKIGRGDPLPLMVTITEKIDGMNACIVIKDGKLAAVQSRNSFLTKIDGTGLLYWARNNADELATMGDGYHYGEWAGLGIQKNRHKIDGRKFFLFNTKRWGTERPSCCNVVPVMYEGELRKGNIAQCLEYLLNGADNPEGVVVYYHFFDTYTKHTFNKSPSSIG